MATLSDATAFEYERCSDSTHLQPQMMSQSLAAPGLLSNDLVCDCQPDACATDCSCLDNSQPCTGACACEAAADGAADGGVEMCTSLLTLPAYEAEADSDVE